MIETFWLLVDSFAFGFAVMFIVVGLVGTLLPLLPGSLLIWVTVLTYSWYADFVAPTPFWVVAMSAILLSTGTSDFWLPIVGAGVTGAPRRSLLYGIIGGIVGLFLFPPLGSLIGYAGGVLLGAYQTHQDWNLAIKASLGGLAGHGVAALIQFGGGLLVLLIFLWSTLGG